MCWLASERPEGSEFGRTPHMASKSEAPTPIPRPGVEPSLPPRVSTTYRISISHKNLYWFDLHQNCCRPRPLAIRAPDASESANRRRRLRGPGVTSTLNKQGAVSAALSDAVEVLLRFAASMLRAGNTATRTREWIEVIAHKMGFDAVSVSLSLDSVTASVRRSGEQAIALREIGPPGINASCIAELEQLAKALAPGSAPAEIAVKLAAIESTKPLYSSAQIAGAVGVASGAFA